MSVARPQAILGELSLYPGKLLPQDEKIFRATAKQRSYSRSKGDDDGWTMQKVSGQQRGIVAPSQQNPSGKSIVIAELRKSKIGCIETLYMEVDEGARRQLMPDGS